jgi:hypothetical protein
MSLKIKPLLAEVDNLRPLSPSRGPVPTESSYVTARTTALRCFVYALQLGKRDTWKIAHTTDPEARQPRLGIDVPITVYYFQNAPNAENRSSKRCQAASSQRSPDEFLHYCLDAGKSDARSTFGTPAH